MAEDVLTYLQSKNLRIKRASNREVNLPCFFCGESEGDRGRLYVNVDPYADIPGLFHCFLCDESGSLVKLKKHFGDYQRPNQAEEDSFLRTQILGAAWQWYQEQLGEHPLVVQWLRGPERGLEVETVVDAGLGYAPSEPRNGLYRHLRSLDFKTADIVASGMCADDHTDVLSGMVTIPYFIAGNCVSIRGRVYPQGESKMKYKTPSGHSARLYGSEALWDESEVFITEGELDALVLRQLGFPAVGVPGANVWQPSWDGYLEGLRRVWIVFDPDEAGDAGAKKLIDRIGPKARRLRLSADVTEWVSGGHTARELRDLMTEAGRSTFLVSVREAVVECREQQTAKALQTGYKYLDLQIAPGIKPGQLVMPLGKTGTGKTILILNVLQNAAITQPKAKFLLLTLEQTRSEWWERAVRIFLFHFPDATEAEAERYWSERLLLVDKNRIKPGEMESILDDFEYEMGAQPDLVALDYLGYWAQAFQGERYERVSDAVMNLKGVAKDRRIPFLVPHQVSRIAKFGEELEIDSSRDGGTIEETADIMLPFWRLDMAKGKEVAEMTGTTVLKIGKSRNGGTGVSMEFVFAPFSLALVPRKMAPDHQLHMALNEVRWHREGTVTTWEQALSTHRRGRR